MCTNHQTLVTLKDNSFVRNSCIFPIDPVIKSVSTLVFSKILECKSTLFLLYFLIQTGTIKLKLIYEIHIAYDGLAKKKQLHLSVRSNNKIRINNIV